VLRANVSHKGRKYADEGNVTPPLQACDPGDLHLRAPRLRWSQPKYTPKRGLVSGTRKVRQAPKLAPRDRIERLGKIRGAILDALDAAGGTLTLQEIADVLHRARPRDLRRRNLPMLEDAGIIVVGGDTVSLADGWLDSLDDQRRLGAEIDTRVVLTLEDGSEKSLTVEGAETVARRRYETKRRAYHRRDEAPKSEPSAASVAAVKRSRESKAAGLAAIAERAAAAEKAEELRRAETFVRDKLQAMGRIRLALLQDIWHDAGGDPWTIPQAVEALGCRVEELPEFDNRRFVFPPLEGAA
jgi:hypothetical protein